MPVIINHFSPRLGLFATISCCLCVFPIFLFHPARAESPKASHVREVNQWHETRIERLTSQDGWLTLAGLLLLEEGENRFGSAAGNDLVFPEKAPEYAGIFVLKNGTVRIEVEDNVDITSGGKPVHDTVLGTDADDETTILEMDSFRFYVIERSEKYYIRLKDLESETLKHFKGIERYPVSMAWRIEARFDPYDPPKKLKVPNVLGFETEEACYGAAVFEVDGVACRLEPMGEPEHGFFFVFGDETSGPETYGGGRFLAADPPDAGGKIVLDFNKAYNPPCAFTPYATCPLPHADNILKVRIEAGEKKYGESSH